MKDFIVMHPKDNCAMALRKLLQGTQLQINGTRGVILNQDIAMGHKFALRPIQRGDLVYKYGQVIGRATQPIELGDWIHVHNIRSVYMEQGTHDG
jgi:hypothetical protein